MLFIYVLALNFSAFQLFNYLYYYSYNKLILYCACARARNRACAHVRIVLLDRLNRLIHGAFRWFLAQSYLIGTGLGDTISWLVRLTGAQLVRLTGAQLVRLTVFNGTVKVSLSSSFAS